MKWCDPFCLHFRLFFNFLNLNLGHQTKARHTEFVLGPLHTTHNPSVSQSSQSPKTFDVFPREPNGTKHIAQDSCCLDMAGARNSCLSASARFTRCYSCYCRVRAQFSRTRSVLSTTYFLVIE